MDRKKTSNDYGRQTLTTPTVLVMAGPLAVSVAFELELLGERARAGLSHGPASTACRADRHDPETIPRWRRPKLRSPAASGALRYAESWADSSQK